MRHVKHIKLHARMSVGDLVNELDMLGIINAKIESKGRYGRTKRIKLLVPQSQVKEVLEDDERIKSISDYAPKVSKQSD